MFLVPIKLGTSKFSPYLILIGFLVHTKKITYNFSPCNNKVCLIMFKLLNFWTIFLDKFKTLGNVHLLKFRIFLTLNELNMNFLKR